MSEAPRPNRVANETISSTRRVAATRPKSAGVRALARSAVTPIDTSWRRTLLKLPQRVPDSAALRMADQSASECLPKLGHTELVIRWGSCLLRSAANAAWEE